VQKSHSPSNLASVANIGCPRTDAPRQRSENETEKLIHPKQRPQKS